AYTACHTQWSHAGHVGQNSSQNRQEVVKICRLQRCIVRGKDQRLTLVSASAQQEAGQDGIPPAFQGRGIMKHLMVSRLVLMLMPLGWSSRSLGEQVPTPRGELRIVDNSSFNFVTVVFNIFEHLLDIEDGGKLVPRLATGWRWVDDRTLEMPLRQGV